jgi:hypothetical protein
VRERAQWIDDTTQTKKEFEWRAEMSNMCARMMNEDVQDTGRYVTNLRSAKQLRKSSKTGVIRLCETDVCMKARDKS